MISDGVYAIARKQDPGSLAKRWLSGDAVIWLDAAIDRVATAVSEVPDAVR